LHRASATSAKSAAAEVAHGGEAGEQRLARIRDTSIA
jgi:hypothetical protein